MEVVVAVVVVVVVIVVLVPSVVEVVVDDVGKLMTRTGLFSFFVFDASVELVVVVVVVVVVVTEVYFIVSGPRLQEARTKGIKIQTSTRILLL